MIGHLDKYHYMIMLAIIYIKVYEKWLIAGKTATVGLLVTALWAMLPVGIPEAKAEYADVVINNYSDKSKVRPVIFPHWFHRIRYTCKVCHADLGFKLKAGGNEIDMAKIRDGKFCGACHNGKIAWGVEKCNLCHTAKPGTPTQMHESTTQPHMLEPLVITSDPWAIKK